MDGKTFSRRMALIKDFGGDPVAMHRRADDLLVEALRALAKQQPDSGAWLIALAEYEDLISKGAD